MRVKSSLEQKLEKDEEFRFGQMDQGMKVTSKIIHVKAMVD